MKKIYFLILLVFATTVANCQLWQAGQGIPSNANIYEIVTYDNYVFAATMNGVYRSSDNGVNWQAKNNGISIDNNTARAFAKSGNRIYLANLNGFYVSEDYGESWMDLELTGDSPSLSAFADDSIVLAGVVGGGLYRSGDYGLNWTPITGDHIYKVVKKDNNYFAGSWDDVLYSTDRGLTWQGTQSGKMTYLLCLINDSVYSCPLDGGLLKTSPTNISWRPVGGVTAHVDGLAYINDDFFIVTYDSVKYSKYQDMDNTWKDISLDGLPSLGADILWGAAISGENLIIGTFNQYNPTSMGIWYAKVEALTDVKENNVKETIETYPNPADNFINISGFIDNTQVSIFDLKGNLLFDKLISNNQIDVADLPSGMYLLKIKINKNIITKKFIKQ